jgi:hypothetical protein
MTDIAVTDLTNSTTADDGSGIFDVLINAVELHIVAQYEEGRITGEDYASVYLGAMQSTLAESVKFLLAEQSAGLEADLLNEKVKSEVKNNQTDGVIDNQVAKLVSEKALLDQKTLTEEAQIEDIVEGSAVAGTVGKKNELFAAQTAGFTRDAEQKMAKIMVDTWNVAKTADPTGISGNTDNNLTDADIGAVIAKAKAGIGI